LFRDDDGDDYTKIVHQNRHRFSVDLFVESTTKATARDDESAPPPGPKS
jgi:hypothetical protein